MHAAHSSTLSDRVLLADIGGTNCRLAVFEPSTQQFVDRAVYATGEFASPRDAIAHFLARIGDPGPRSAALALACPITGSKVRLTNTEWSFDQADLSAYFSFERLVLVNDLVAQARGLCELPREAFMPIGPLAPASWIEPAAIVNAGTGLGIARIDDFEHRRVFGSEGGHIGFSPSDDIEMALLALWRPQLGRVSNEHVVSGPGMVRLHRGLGALAGIHVEPIDGPEIVRRAVAGSDTYCVETAERFAKILGSVSADACLAFCASTVFLAGSITHALAPIIAQGGFRERFEQRGAGGAFLKKVPTAIATGSDLGLFGAYACLLDA